MKNYTERMRDLREDHDKTQQEVAGYLGTTQQVYSRYEKGINEIPVRHIIALCKYYGVSADYLLGLTDQNEKGRAE
ncbi:MAG: helix-turn-helix transcriptional regulator [Clostridiales bacterium]|nr:helix-turn-helix transcriptional regulator [Clostridiales bacterium]